MRGQGSALRSFAPALKLTHYPHRRVMTMTAESDNIPSSPSASAETTTSLLPRVSMRF